MSTKLLFVFGTRPEAIKLCPVVEELKASFPVRVCVTGQHRALLDQTLSLFGLKPDIDLDIMQPGQTLAGAAARMLAALGDVIAAEQPGAVLVQGDTSSTFCGALAAFYARVPVAHVEAGLRTGDLAHPFPEEANRVLTARLAALHFPPTPAAAENLLREGVAPERVIVTGNTGLDALRQVRARIAAGQIPVAPWPFPEGRWILVTGHRRENFGEGFTQICQALLQLAELPGTQVIYPVHPNPQVRGPVARLLGGHRSIHLIDPLDYAPFVDLMSRATLILTDSGGVQEEAPSLGKPVLVMREKTERPEAVTAGTARLVGTDAARIVAEARLLLEDAAEYERRCRIHNPYGDGYASGRIAAALQAFFARP